MKHDQILAAWKAYMKKIDRTTGMGDIKDNVIFAQFEAGVCFALGLPTREAGAPVSVEDDGEDLLG
jgi:hypothetical protein